MESVAQMASRLVAEGYSKFIGKGLVIERAHKRGELLAIGGNAERLEYYDYHDYLLILPDTAPAQTRPPQTDFIKPDISEHPPGSKARLEALAAFYDGQGENGQSACYISDNRIAERIASALVERDSHTVIDASEHSAKHYRASTITE